MRIKKIILCFWTAFLIILAPFSAQASSVSASVLVNLTNQARKQAGLGNLIVSPALTSAAKLKAEDMIKKDYFAHTSPEGVNSWYWFKKVGFNYHYAGENLAINFSDSGSLFSAWMASTSHRDNIIDPKYSEIGIFSLQGEFQGHQTIVVVQMFGSRFHQFSQPKTSPQVVSKNPMVLKNQNHSQNFQKISKITPQNFKTLNFMNQIIKSVNRFWFQIYLKINEPIFQKILLVLG